MWNNTLISKFINFFFLAGLTLFILCDAKPVLKNEDYVSNHETRDWIIMVFGLLHFPASLYSRFQTSNCISTTTYTGSKET